MTKSATLFYENQSNQRGAQRGGATMIAIKTQLSLRNARQYFREHLSSGDYYNTSSITPGMWLGQAASVLGLAGTVQESDFLALCNGQRPDGTKLTKRLNTTREGGVANRRIFFDWTFCPPKSVSIAGLVQGDKRVIEAHQNAVARAAAELEKYAAVRVRRAVDPLNGKDRTTGNLVAAAFTHETSRAVDASIAPDPLLHTHLIVFNATLDGEEWRALQNFQMLRSQGEVRAVYDRELKTSLKAMGYKLRKGEASWELAHVADATIQKFSKRRSAILAEVVRLRQKGARGSEHDLKDRIAHEKRIRKTKGEHAGTLRASWLAQLEGNELELVMSQSVRSASKPRSARRGERIAKPQPSKGKSGARDWILTAARAAGRIEEAIAEAEELEIFR